MDTNGQEPTTSFKLDGNNYEVEVNVFTIEEVRKVCGVDLLKCFEEDAKVLEVLATDRRKLVDMLFLLCEESCVRHGLDDRGFGRAFKTMDKLQEAADAFVNALINFFPSHQRGPLRKLMKYSRQLEAEQADKIEKVMNDPRLESKLQSELTKLDEQFASALESWESTLLEDAPSES